MCEVSPTSTCVPTETAALFRIKEPPKSVLRYGAESRIITLKRKTKLTRIPTIRLPVTRLSSLNFFITHHHPFSLYSFVISVPLPVPLRLDRVQFFDRTNLPTFIIPFDTLFHENWPIIPLADRWENWNFIYRV